MADQKRQTRRQGQIVSKGENKWLVRIYIGTDAGGKRLYHNKTIHGLKKDANAWLTAALRRRDLGEAIEQSKETLGDALDAWLKLKSKTVKPSSLASYQVVINLHIPKSLKDRSLPAIRPKDIQDLLNNLSDGNRAPDTIRLVRAVLNNLYSLAIDFEQVRSNPVKKTRAPRSRTRINPMTPEQVRALLCAAESTDESCLLSFAVETGSRPGEYLSLTWPDIDLNAATVTIKRTLERSEKGAPITTEPKTKAAMRTIPLSVEMVKLLRVHQAEQRRRAMELGSRYAAHNLVFPALNGKTVERRSLHYRFKRLLKKSGLSPAFCVYDLRHTCATLLLLARVNPKVVAERLGHANVAFTLQTYSHVLPGIQGEATASLARLIFTEQAG